ncbi:MAG: succinate dehydrogenase assembly factor 2 [Gammaproteobacteria bacterium]|nr:succinate dehydrogenase assembly factor 2 [Gammaproteobacteria bacterium]
MDEERTGGRAGKARWRSRRGMLEVENELLPFVRERFDDLEAADRHAYARLLEEDDWTIHDWLRGASQPADAALRRIVALIRQARSDDGARDD